MNRLQTGYVGCKLDEDETVEIPMHADMVRARMLESFSEAERK